MAPNKVYNCQNSPFNFFGRIDRLSITMLAIDRTIVTAVDWPIVCSIVTLLSAIRPGQSMMAMSAIDDSGKKRSPINRSFCFIVRDKAIFDFM